MTMIYSPRLQCVVKYLLGIFLFVMIVFAAVVAIVDVADTAAAAVTAPFSENDMIYVVASSPKRSG